MDVAIFIGLQGSGKSTFYRHHLSATHALVSKDRMRNARDKNRRQIELIREALLEGRSVAVDNTNPAPEDRAPLVACARAHGARVIGYFFDAAITDCVKRNQAREGRARVPVVAIYRTAKRLKAPALGEGFDALYRVTLAGEAFRVEHLREQTPAR